MRRVREWVGKTDDADPTPTAKLRICRRQQSRCAMCGRQFGASNQPEFDHAKEIWEGGENRESNIRAVCPVPCHKVKTAEANKRRAKADRMAKSTLGLKPKYRRSRPMPGTRASGWKHKFSGGWEPR